ncbi:DUF5723 family protein [Bacteroides congonensis]|uniref:DUF5723 family protein n=1 Tax=Bacteroides congonensis TaxID=1871006 RepID=UPI0025A42934|nr:DUF5723 family protein [Bacteroides congonensis]
MATNKLLWSSKLIGVFSIMLVCALSANAQFLRTSYFMEGVHYRQQLNPALTPGRGYINLPVVGAFNVSASSKSFGYQDIKDIIDNSEGSDYFTSDDFMKRLKDDNQLNINLNTDILSAGWYKGKNFWSFNVGLRVDMGASIPKSMFSFMREMNGVDFESLDWSNFDRQIGKESLEINSYAEIGLGYARQINDRLTVGGKLKALLGIGNLKLDVKSIGVNTELSGVTADTDWSNLTPEQIANIHGTANIDVEASLESSFKGLNLRNGEEGYIDDFDFEAGDMGIAGYGAAIDLGASYKLLDNLTVSAALLDLGFISWSKGSTSMAKASTDGLSFDSRNEGDIERFANIVSSGEILNYDMLHMEMDETGAKSRKTWLHSTMVFGAEYSLLNNWLVVGALSTTRFTKPKTMSELTLSANIRPKNYFNVAVSYSMLQSAGKSVGLALKLGPLFVGTDYMFFGNNTKCCNAFLGISIPLNKRKVNKQG